MKNKILLIDDENDILEFLSYNLKKEGYIISTASNGKEGLKIVNKFRPDLIIVDIMMPILDGIEFCSLLRADSKNENIIIVFLTARNEDYTQIVALDSGADDFIAKPIKPRLLLSKIKSLFNRSIKNRKENNILTHKNLKLNEDNHQVLIDDIEYFFPKKEFEILKKFLENPSKVLTRESILNEIWGTDLYVGDRTIDVHIKRIRSKIGQQRIRTIKGV
tara:strand:+ start:56 stop:712 length:657 start_codon:yes stop_codon:yes gene_type:complete